jgi:hypothetical protein
MIDPQELDELEQLVLMVVDLRLIPADAKTRIKAVFEARRATEVNGRRRTEALPYKASTWGGQKTPAIHGRTKNPGYKNH